MKEAKKIKKRVKKLLDILEIDHLGLITDGIDRLMKSFKEVIKENG